MTNSRGRSRSAANFIMRRVTVSIPAAASTITITVSTAGSEAMALPMKSGAPGESIRLM